MLKTPSIFQQQYVSNLPALFGLLLCAYVLSSAIPRFISAIYFLYPQHLSEQYKKKTNHLGLSSLHKSKDYIKTSLSWHQNSANWQALAILKIRQLELSTLNKEASQIALTEIYQDSRHSIALSPVSPYNWYRLALIAKLQQHPDKEVLGSLRLSYYAGRVERDLLINRIKLLFQYTDILDKEMKMILKDQVHLANKIVFKELLVLVSKNPELFPVVQETLQYDLEQWQKFILHFEKYN